MDTRHIVLVSRPFKAMSVELEVFDAAYVTQAQKRQKRHAKVQRAFTHDRGHYPHPGRRPQTRHLLPWSESTRRPIVTRPARTRMAKRQVVASSR